MALSLFAYMITAFIVRPDWSKVLAATFSPSWPTSHAQWSTLVAILGTTISPYLFFWQSSQEVELEKARGQRTSASRRGGDPQELKDRAIDVGVGAFFSNIIMYFIILTTALTLHADAVHVLGNAISGAVFGSAVNRRLGPGGLSTERVKRQNLLGETFIQQLKIFATQTGYWLSIGFRYGDIEVNEPLSFIEHRNGWLRGLLNLRGRCQEQAFGPSAAVLHIRDGAQE